MGPPTQLANAVSRPDQFQEVVDGLERLKPGLGQATLKRLAAAKEEGGGFARVLKRVPAIRADPGPSIYNRRGELEALFDGGPSYPSR